MEGRYTLISHAPPQTRDRESRESIKQFNSTTMKDVCVWEEKGGGEER